MKRFHATHLGRVHHTNFVVGVASMSLDDVPQFISNIVKRQRLSPSAQDLEYLSKTDVGELRLFFNMLNEGKSDMDVYNACIDHCRRRNDPKYVPEKAAPKPQKKVEATTPPSQVTPPPPPPSVRCVSEMVDIVVEDLQEKGLNLSVRNRGATTLMRIDFSSSFNFTFHPESHTKRVDDHTYELTAVGAATTKLGSMSITDTSVLTSSLGYSVMFQQGSLASQTTTVSTTSTVEASSDDVERRKIADDLFLVINSVDDGYDIDLDNKHASVKYEVTLDLTNCENLKVCPDALTSASGMQVTRIVDCSSKVHFVKLPVDDFGKGACELRYKTSLKKLS